VPLCPELVAILRRHLGQFGTAPDGRIVATAQGAIASDSWYGRVWTMARTMALSEAQAASPLAQRPYDLRHAAVSTWLNAGVPVTQVAEWAGHTVEVLLKVYAKCLDGQETRSKRLIESYLNDPEHGPSDQAAEDS
jgi:integrase